MSERAKTLRTRRRPREAADLLRTVAPRRDEKRSTVARRRSSFARYRATKVQKW